MKSKRAQLNIRTPPELLALLHRAAEAAGTDLASWARGVLERAARRRLGARMDAAASEEDAHSDAAEPQQSVDEPHYGADEWGN